MGKFTKLAVCLVTLGFIANSMASIDAVRIPDAKFLFVDYGEIRRGTPSLSSASEREIDEWLSSEVFYLKKRHVEIDQDLAGEIHGSIKYQMPPKKIDAFIPTRYGYGRGLIFKTGRQAKERERLLLDGKGFGAKDPSPFSHNHGLMTLGEALREKIYSLMLQRIFDHSGSGLKAGEVWAVIDWGFKVQNTPGNWVPAGAVVRPFRERWHQPRYIGDNNFLDEVSTVIVERVLRAYGFKSSGEGLYRSQNGQLTDLIGDVANVQGTIPFSDGKIGPIIDFGAFFHGKPVGDLIHYFYRKEAMLAKDSGGRIPDPPHLFSPLSPPSWQEVDPTAVSALSTLWGAPVGLPQNPQYDSPFIDCNRLAEEWHAGRIGLTDVSDFIRKRVFEISLPLTLLNRFTDIQSTDSKLEILREIIKIQLEQNNLSEITLNQWLHTVGTEKFADLEMRIANLILTKQIDLLPLIESGENFERYKSSVDSILDSVLGFGAPPLHSFNSSFLSCFGVIVRYYFEFTKDPNDLLLGRIKMFLERFPHDSGKMFLRERKGSKSLNAVNSQLSLNLSRGILALLLKYRPATVSNVSVDNHLPLYQYLAIQSWVEADPVRILTPRLFRLFLENSKLANFEKLDMAKSVFERLDKSKLKEILKGIGELNKYGFGFENNSDWYYLYEIFLNRFPVSQGDGLLVEAPPKPKKASSTPRIFKCVDLL